MFTIFPSGKREEKEKREEKIKNEKNFYLYVDKISNKEYCMRYEKFKLNPMTITKILEEKDERHTIIEKMSVNNPWCQDLLSRFADYLACKKIKDAVCNSYGEISSPQPMYTETGSLFWRKSEYNLKYKQWWDEFRSENTSFGPVMHTLDDLGIRGTLLLYYFIHRFYSGEEVRLGNKKHFEALYKEITDNPTKIVDYCKNILNGIYKLNFSANPVCYKPKPAYYNIDSDDESDDNDGLFLINVFSMKPGGLI